MACRQLVVAAMVASALCSPAHAATVVETYSKAASRIAELEVMSRQIVGCRIRTPEWRASLMATIRRQYGREVALRSVLTKSEVASADRDIRDSVSFVSGDARNCAELATRPYIRHFDQVIAQGGEHLGF